MMQGRVREKAGGQNKVVELTQDNVGEITRGLPFHARHALRALTRMHHGSLTVELPGGAAYHFKAPGQGPEAELVIHDWRFARRAIMGGSVGVAESYMDGDWTSPDVTAFLSLFLANEELYRNVATPNWFNNALQKLNHWFNQNSRRGSRRNIASHYDLGNEFYSRWLDSTMTYSSAIFEEGDNSLAAAQRSKYRSLAKSAHMGSGQHVLEIGCGWGGFAEYAAKEVGCHVTGLTISREQYDFARERMFRQGLNERVEIKFQDYRDETGKYDAIASIEMFEAVGEKYWPAYFGKLHDCLKAGGRAGLQIITIADTSYDYYRSHPDFIQRYIFPGGMLPSPSILSRLSIEHGLTLMSERMFPRDYARTLAEWREKFVSAWEDIRPMGFDLRFKRMWEFYLHYCEAGFLSDNIDVRQLFYQRS
ncbi:MAG TPA: cyclopropane-fatty-acyl-phospholipid synthase family protein [Rhizobiaceae bacterium]|nr:cyclopropane-fatty-acyl-phospholipid synthase family protein [Rhizobiaceae bacterium]